MSSAKRLKQLGGGQFYKFDTPGQKLEGVWQGTQAGKFGENGTVEVNGQPLMFSLNAALKDLIRVKPGTSVLIEYRGKQTAKNGNEFKAFNVFVDADEGTAIEDEPDSDVPF